MNKLIVKLLVIMTGVFLIIFSFFAYATKGLGPAFGKSYVAVFETKYNQLISKDREPSVILVGGSNLAFGINQYLLSLKTNRPIINTGVHAGFNPIFMTEIIRDNVIEGDTVILAFETTAYTDLNAFTKIGAALVMQAIDTHISIYKYIPVQMYPQIIDELIPFVELKVKVQKEQKECTLNSAYSRCAFDENGQMIFSRNNNTITKEMINDKYTLSKERLVIKEENMNYLSKFVNDLKNKGVDVVIVAPAISKQAFGFTNEEYIEFYDKISERLEVKLICNPLDYAYNLEYMYDTIFHLNSAGENIRTLQLANDLMRYFNGE